MKHFVRDLATNQNLWNEYIDPSGQGGNDFNIMATEDKMRMIVDLWPEDVREDDEEGQHILLEIRRERSAAAAVMGRSGGRSTSAIKSRTARENGKRGGRPRHTQ